jgi:hypothetical protein
MLVAAVLVASVGIVGGTPAFASSGIGGKITRSELIARAYNWYERKPAYNPGGSLSDAGQTRPYRTDCSGFVDMAWHLNSDDNTDGFASQPSRFVEISGRGGAKSGLQPGDVLDDTIDGHAFLFEGWESDHVHFSYFNFGGGSSGNAPPEHHTHETFSQAEVGFEPTGNYAAYRYVNVVDDPGVSAVYDTAGAYHVFAVNKDGVLYQRIHQGNAWETWQKLGGTVHGTPGVTYHDGRYDVFAIGGNGVLYQQTYVKKWLGWHAVGGSNLAGGVEALYVNGAYHVFAANKDGTLYQIIHSGKIWGAWQNLGGAVHGTPGITYHENRYDVFAVGGNGAVYQQTYNCAGNRSLSQLRRALTPEGTLVIVGSETPNRWFGGVDRLPRAMILSAFVRQNLRGVLSSNERPDDLEFLRTCLEDGTITPVIDRTYPLSAVSDAVRCVHKGHTRGKVVITV